MSNRQHEDLDLLLSLHDRVLETPPGSPSARSSGYLSNDGSPKQIGQADMSVFRNGVQDCMDYEPQKENKALKFKPTKSSNHEGDVEKFSGLRIRNQLVSPTELSNRFADIRFIRLTAIKNLLVGDTLSGCWATVGVLTEKGSPKTSSTGKTFSVWKFNCLDENHVSVFLFGDAYQKNCKEEAGTVFALFNCNARKDTSENRFSLSVYSAGQILKMGTSMDYGVCKGKRKDGMPCTLVINKRRGIYCKFHKQKVSEKYSITRTELKGGNLRTAFRYPLKSEGIYVVDPLSDRTNLKKPMQPLKLLSVDCLKKALSKAGKVTTNVHSQGIRFLNEMTGKTTSKVTKQGDSTPKHPMKSSEKRSSSSAQLDLPTVRTIHQQITKKQKIGENVSAEKIGQSREKMIELDFVSSDEEI